MLGCIITGVLEYWSRGFLTDIIMTPPGDLVGKLYSPPVRTVPPPSLLGCLMRLEHGEPKRSIDDR